MFLYIQEKEIQKLYMAHVILYIVKSGPKSKYVEMLCGLFPIRKFIFRIQKGDFASRATFQILSVEF